MNWYQVRMGHDGKIYAVFPNEYERWQFHNRWPHVFENCPPACFGQFDNAFELPWAE